MVTFKSHHNLSKLKTAISQKISTNLKNRALDFCPDLKLNLTLTLNLTKKKTNLDRTHSIILFFNNYFSVWYVCVCVCVFLFLSSIIFSIYTALARKWDFQIKKKQIFSIFYNQEYVYIVAWYNVLYQKHLERV